MRVLQLVIVSFSLASLSAADNSFLIRGATIHPVTSAEIANGSVLVMDGKIAEVGARVAVPKGVRIIDGKGLHVYPGMIDGASELGLSEVSSVRESVDITELGDFNPQLRAEVAVNPSSEHIPVTRANGITSSIALPAAGTGRGFGGGAGSIIGGQAALIHLDGWTWEDMDIRRSAAMQLIFPIIQSVPARFQGFGGPRTTYAEAKKNHETKLRELDDFFEAARRYQKAKAAPGSDFKIDLKLEAMLPVLDGKEPVFVQAVKERAIKEALAFADRQKIRIILAGIREVTTILPDLKAKNIPVILGPTLALPEEDDDPYDSAATLPSELLKAGVKFAFGTFDVQFARNLPYQAAAAVGFGLPYDEALKAVTINTAEIFGVGDQVGSIDKGKWADLIVTDGDPLEAKTNVKQVFIKGQQSDLATRHTRLYEKYLARP